jgi:hypothetical protein
MFGRLLGSRSFNSLEGPPTCKQVFFPITFGGIRLISTTIIPLIDYLRSWAFIVSIIFARFMVDHPPFLFETLT